MEHCECLREATANGKGGNDGSCGYLLLTLELFVSVYSYLALQLGRLFSVLCFQSLRQR